MKQLKLNQLEKNELNVQEKALIIGGSGCGCSCYYANNGGSSIEDNYSANNGLGTTSIKGETVMSDIKDDFSASNMMCL